MSDPFTPPGALFSAAPSLLRQPTIEEIEAVIKDAFEEERHRGTDYGSTRGSIRKYVLLKEAFPVTTAVCVTTFVLKNLGTPIDVSAIETLSM